MRARARVCVCVFVLVEPVCGVGLDRFGGLLLLFAESFTDESGLTIYTTSTPREYNAGTFVH